VYNYARYSFKYFGSTDNQKVTLNSLPIGINSKNILLFSCLNDFKSFFFKANIYHSAIFSNLGLCSARYQSIGKKRTVMCIPVPEALKDENCGARWKVAV